MRKDKIGSYVLDIPRTFIREAAPSIDKGCLCHIPYNALCEISQRSYMIVSDITIRAEGVVTGHCLDYFNTTTYV